jgi:hypothetical protein
MKKEIKNESMSGAEGTNVKKIRTIDLVLALLVTASGAFFFLFVSRSISGVAYSTWLIPIVMATVFSTLLSVFGVVSSVKKMAMPITIIAFLPSVIFMPVLTHISVTTIMMAITIHGLYVMRRTLFNTLKIDMGTIVRSGAAYVSIALVIVVSSQYYFSLKDGSARVALDASEHVRMSNMVADFLLSQSNIENVSIDAMTVDEFLHFLAKNAYTQETAGPRIPVEDEGLIIRWADEMGVDLEKVEEDTEDMVVEQMRINLASILERDLTGGEQMADVFSEIISAQINKIMAQNEVLRNNQAEIFGIIFFLVIFSLASVIRIMSNLLARFIFMTLRESKIVRVSRIQRDAEVIEM